MCFSKLTACFSKPCYGLQGTAWWPPAQERCCAAFLVGLHFDQPGAGGQYNILLLIYWKSILVSPVASSAILINLVRVVNMIYWYWYWYWNGKLVLPVVSCTFWSTWAFTIFIFVGSVPYCHLCTNMHTFRANRCADIKCEEILQMMRTRPQRY